jgi:hypothetical protein
MELVSKESLEISDFEKKIKIYGINELQIYKTRGKRKHGDR